MSTQEINENLDHMHPEWPAQYVLVNEEKGVVIWYENHASAVKMRNEHDGVVFNTQSVPPQVLKAALANAHEKMNNRNQNDKP